MVRRKRYDIVNKIVAAIERRDYSIETPMVCLDRVELGAIANDILLLVRGDCTCLNVQKKT